MSESGGHLANLWRQVLSISALISLFAVSCGTSDDGDSGAAEAHDIETAALDEWAELPFLMVQIGSFKGESQSTTAITPWYYAVGGGVPFDETARAVVAMPSLKQLGVPTDHFSGNTHIESWYEVENISVSRVIEGRDDRVLGVLTHTIDLAELVLLDLDGDSVVDILNYVQPTVGEIAASLTSTGDDFVSTWFESLNPFCSDSFSGTDSYNVSDAFRVDMCEISTPTSFDTIALESSAPTFLVSDGELALGSQLIDPPLADKMEDVGPSRWATLIAAVKATNTYHEISSAVKSVTSGPHLDPPNWRSGRDLANNAGSDGPRLIARVPASPTPVSGPWYRNETARRLYGGIMKVFGATIVDEIAERTLGLPVTPPAVHEWSAHIVMGTARLIEQPPGGSSCAGAQRCYRSELPPETFGLYFVQSEVGPLPQAFIPEISETAILGPGLFVDPTVGEVVEPSAGNAAEINPDAGSVAGTGCSWTYTAQGGVVDGCGRCNSSSGGFAALGEVVACSAANAADEVLGPLTESERRRLQGAVETDPGITAEIQE